MKTHFVDNIRADSILFLVVAGLLFLVPLTFSTSVHRTSTLPKFALLLCGASVVLLMLILSTISKSIQLLGTISSWPFRLMALFLLTIAVSTLDGEAPLASLFGSYLNQMGFLTHLCLFLVYFGLVTSTHGHNARLIWALWAIALAGLLAGAYATAQFFGRDPSLSASSYTFYSSGTPIIRPPGTLGHPDLLAHLLLYTWPVGLALARLSTGSARRIALAGCGFSLFAILLSGTRGAWLGALAGAFSFFYLELRTRSSWRQRLKAIGVALAVAAALLLAVGLIGPVRLAVFSRARDLLTEGVTGAGRTYLWRDALKTVPRYSIIGCGPEAFSKAFPPYRSEELARYSARVSNESSHNAYLDAAISYGLPGGVLYLAIVLSALYRLFQRGKDASEPSQQVIAAGIAAALAGAAVHKMFIYDQVSTGLYFYAFMALALIASAGEDSHPLDLRTDHGERSSEPGTTRRGRGLAVVVGFITVVASVWYAILLLRCDGAVKRAYVAAAMSDVEALEENCSEAAKSPDPTRAYSFAAAQAVVAYVTKLPTAARVIAGGAPDSPERSRAIAMGRFYGEQSLAHSLTPGDNYVLLAYFALRSADTAALDAFAKEAIRWDPFNLNARWLMAEALLAQGNREAAVREATFALSVSPGFDRAKSIVVRARTEAERTERMITRASVASGRGNFRKAERLLKRAIRLSNAGCAPCHRALALLYEQIDRRDQAISEWREYQKGAPDQARDEDIEARIGSLGAKRK